MSKFSLVLEMLRQQLAQDWSGGVVRYPTAEAQEAADKYLIERAAEIEDAIMLLEGAQ